MCGRFSLNQSGEAITKAFHLENIPTITSRYNIAPNQLILGVLQSFQSTNREAKMFHWGLISPWTKGGVNQKKLINVRAETVAEKPIFKQLFQKHRCLIVADGFYEWQHKEGKKQPFYCRLSYGQVFAFAGLWDSYKTDSGEIINSCAILTTQANELILPIHDRMPVIIEPKDYDLWLDSEVNSPYLLQPLLKSYPFEEMTVYQVSNQVNKATNDIEDCINSI